MAADGRLAHLAAAIADGAAIDWDAAESDASDADRPLLERLKQLAALADLHRSFASGAADARSPVGDGTSRASARRWGSLLLLDRIGGGAFGEVFRAWDENLRREVALKLLPVPTHRSEASNETLLEEGRALARVRHPNVVTIYGAEVIDGSLGLWMELVEGRTLEQSIADRSRFEPNEVGAIGIALCGALAAVHEAGLLHRDVKASNVMMAGDGRLVLMDFGAGRDLDGAAGAPLRGTPLYLAPELFTGSEPSTASDVYSVGVVLYRLLTGSYPVSAEDLDGLRAAHRRGERAMLRTALPGVPEGLARVLDRALEPDAARRHSTATALATDLAALERPRSPRTAWMGGVAAAVVLVAGLALIPALRDDDATSNRPTAGQGSSLGAAPADGEAGAERPAIVVLPFDNSGPQADDTFVDGLTEEILRDLARVDGLAVRSRYSSFTFREEPRDLAAIGRRLEADLAVTGSVARTGDRLRIQAQLVDLARDRPLWAERFDRDLHSTGDAFAVVDEIARSIVNELRLTLGTGRRRYDTDLEVYARFLEARALAERRGLKSPRDAIGILEQILAADPTFAPAQALLADAYGYMSMLAYQSPVSHAEALDRMRRAATRALELDPMLAEAHAALGLVRAWERSWTKSEESFERALDLDPTLTAISTSYSFWTLRPQRKLERAQQVLESALESDPLSLDVEREIAELAFSRGRYDEVFAGLERIRAVDPDLPFVNMFLGRAMIFDGRPDEGLALLEVEQARGRPNSHYQAHALVKLGRRAEVERLALEHRGFPNREAVIHAALGDLDRSLEALERMMISEPHRVPILLTYPELAALHDDPRLAAFRQRFGLP